MSAMLIRGRAAEKLSPAVTTRGKSQAERDADTEVCLRWDQLGRGGAGELVSWTDGLGLMNSSNSPLGPRSDTR